MDAPGTAEQATATALQAATPDATGLTGHPDATSMESPAAAANAKPDPGASGTPVPSSTVESGGGATNTTAAEKKEAEQAAANTTGAGEKTEQAEDPSSSAKREAEFAAAAAAAAAAPSAAGIPSSSWVEQRAAMMARARARVAGQEIRGHPSPDPIERGQPFFYKENEARPGEWRRTKGTVRQNHQNKPILVKMLLLGASATGAKTCAMRAFAENDYSDTFITTIGIDYKIKMVELESGLQANVQVWDTAGQERFQRITHAYCKGADVLYLGYDICDRNSYNDIERRFLPMVREHCAEGTPIVVVGNKCDRRAEDRAVTVEEGEALARRAAWGYKTAGGGGLLRWLRAAGPGTAGGPEPPYSSEPRRSVGAGVRSAGWAGGDRRSQIEQWDPLQSVPFFEISAKEDINITESFQAAIVLALMRKQQIVDAATTTATPIVAVGESRSGSSTLFSPVVPGSDGGGGGGGGGDGGVGGGGDGSVERVKFTGLTHGEGVQQLAPMFFGGSTPWSREIHNLCCAEEREAIVAVLMAAAYVAVDVREDGGRSVGGDGGGDGDGSDRSGGVGVGVGGGGSDGGDGCGGGVVGGGGGASQKTVTHQDGEDGKGDDGEGKGDDGEGGGGDGEHRSSHNRPRCKPHVPGLRRPRHPEGRLHLLTRYHVLIHVLSFLPAAAVPQWWFGEDWVAAKTERPERRCVAVEKPRNARCSLQ